MTHQQKDALSKLAQHFKMADGGREVRGNEENDIDAESVEPRRPDYAPNNPWKRFLRIATIDLSPVVREHLRECGTDAKLFVNDQSLLTMNTSRGNESAGNALLASYRYTPRLERRQTKDSVRWRFNMLMYYDMAKSVRPTDSKCG